MENIFQFESVSAGGRPVLKPGETTLHVQSGVGLYVGQKRLEQFDKGTLYLTNKSLIWTGSSETDQLSTSLQSWRLDLSRIIRQEVYHGMLNSHPKLIVDIEPVGGPEHQSKAKVPLWTCPICSFSNSQPTTREQFLKCDECGVKSAISHVEISCPVCTFAQNFPMDGCCTMCQTSWMPVQSSANITPVQVKFSFRSGGFSQFYEKFIDTFRSKTGLISATRDTLTPSSSVSPHSTVGLASIMNNFDLAGKQRKGSLEESFKDLDALISSAQQMMEMAQSLAQKISDVSVSSDGNDSEIRKMLLNLGLDDLVARENSGNQYYEELARQIADFSMPLVKKSGGMLSLTDLYCFYNRARGISLISPNDLYQSVKLFEKLSLPIRFKKFASGLRVVHTQEFDESAVMNRIRAYLRERTYLTAISFLEFEKISLQLSQELLLVAETRGVLCRDEISFDKRHVLYVYGIKNMGKIIIERNERVLYEHGTVQISSPMKHLIFYELLALLGSGRELGSSFGRFCRSKQRTRVYQWENDNSIMSLQRTLYEICMDGQAKKPFAICLPRCQ